MTDDRRPPDGGDATSEHERNQRWLERAANLVLETETLPGPASIPYLATLRERARWRKVRRRIVLAGIPATAAAALGLFLATGRPLPRDPAPLTYVVEGAATVQADSIEAATAASPPSVPGTGAAAGAGTRVRFTDGTVVSLDPGTRMRVPARTAAGANLILDRGRASFTVTHRPGAKWHVTTGPFIVDVTGTRFSLAWESAAQRLTLNLESGGVIVRGSAAGPGVSVRPGQTLIASAADGRFTVTPSGQLPINPGVVRPTLALASPSITERRGARRAGRAEGSPGPGRPEESRDHAPRPDLQPPSIIQPSAPSLVAGGGGVFCARERSEFSFEGSEHKVSVPPVYHLAMSGPRSDKTHSWCGVGSVKLDLNFHESGRRNFMGRLPNQSGQMVISLPHLVDFTDKNVSLHVYIDGPPEARIAAQLYVIHHGKWVNGPLVDHLVPKRWWTINHTFRAENPLNVGPPYPPAGTSLVTDCDRIALIIYSTGGPRNWSGAVYVDDIAWK